MQNFFKQVTLSLMCLFSCWSFPLSINKTSTEHGFIVKIDHNTGRLIAIKDELGARIEIETERILVKTTLQDDLNCLVQFYTNPENVIMDGTGKPQNDECVREYYHTHWLPSWEKGMMRGALTLFLKSEANKIIGQVSITCDGAGTGNLGLLIDKPYWRQGYGGEVCKIIHDLWAPLLIFLKADFNGKPFEKLFFTTSIDNDAVVHLADKYGSAVFADLRPIEKEKIRNIEPNLRKIKRWNEHELSNVVEAICSTAALLENNQLACKNFEKNKLFCAWATKVFQSNLDSKENLDVLLVEFDSILPNEVTTWRCCTEQNSIRSIWIQSCFDGTIIRPPKYCFLVFAHPEKKFQNAKITIQ